MDLYLNNVSIRKSTKILGCSSSLLVRWLKELASNLRCDLFNVDADLESNSIPEVIEIDEIYTRVKKGPRVSVWVSYSRRRGKVVAYVIGTISNFAIELYNLTKRAVGSISRIYTDGNSSYIKGFAALGVSDLHIVAPGKSDTHMIESVNSSIRIT